MPKLPTPLSTLCAALMALPLLPAAAQDNDGDGAPDSADAFPCDATRAAVTYFPSETELALLAFEDQWPAATDLDFNDVVVRVHQRLDQIANGRVARLTLTVDPVALGGMLSSGLGLQLPVDRAGVTARRRIAGGAWESVALQSDANVTVLASPNLRELFANAAGQLNAVPGEPTHSGQRLELEITFATPVVLSAAAAPYDVFIFRADAPSHQIHFPQFSGTAAMNTALFGTGEDGSTATRRFVHTSGIPAALRLMSAAYYPQEGVEVSDLFPQILTFASSAGTQATGFYTSPVPSFGYAVPPRTLAAAGPADTSCIPPTGNVVQSGLLLHLDAAAAGSVSGTTWSDLSGNGRHATLTNGAAFAPGVRGGSIALDGIDDFVNVPNGFTSMFRSRTAWTVSVWLTVRRFNAGADYNPVIVSVDSSGGAGYYELFLETSPSTTWMAAGGALISQSLTTNTDTVYNFVWVLSGSTARMYRNGQLVHTAASGMVPMSNVTGNLWLGRFKTGDYELDGWLHHAQVYGRALTPAELQQNYDAVRGRFGL